VADVLDERTVSLAGAQRVLAAALALAERMSVHVSVAVAGRAGDLKAFARMDGASTLSAETARRKVYTVAATGMSTKEFGSILKSEMSKEPELFHGMIGIDGLIAFAGGVPIRLDGQRVGAVAVSGGTSAQDQEIAEASAAVITSRAAG
jgi:glc operon protein GlcG